MTLPPALSNLQPSYNVRPTDPADVVAPSRPAIEWTRWGLSALLKPISSTRGRAPRWAQGTWRSIDNDYLQRWPVLKRVNSSKQDAEDATLIL